MDAYEALKIFGLKDIRDTNSDLLKKKFKRLIKKYHPDVGGNEEMATNINLAYELLRELISKLPSNYTVYRQERLNIIIPIDELPKVYLGEKLEIGNNGAKIIIDKQSLMLYNIIILIKVLIEYKGRKFSFEALEILNIRDEYFIDCRIKDDGYLRSEKLVIKVGDKIKGINMVGNHLDLFISFGGLVKLKVRVSRSA